MNVSQAMQQRKSIRAFLDQPVATEDILDLLQKASRSPSGGNVQPWKIFVLNGDSMTRFREHVKGDTRQEQEEYAIYPQGLKEPHRSTRFQVGEQMYALLNIPREDKMARLTWLMENFDFFKAPAALFCYVDRQMGPPQWSDLGMFLQSFMLLAEEAGLNTCAQEAWSTRPQLVREFVGAPEEQMLFCGMAIGHKDPEAAVNDLVSERLPLAQFVQVL